MKRIPISLYFISVFSAVGLLFSGYLAGTKLFSGACAFNETCPIVLGLPACFYGFALYVILTTLTILTVRERYDFEKGILSISAVSLLGICFAGYLTITELPIYVKHGFAAYTFGVPTCFLGLVFFMLIFVTGMIAWSHHRDRNR